MNMWRLYSESVNKTIYQDIKDKPPDEFSNLHGQKSGTFSGRGCWLRNYSIAKNSIKIFLI